MTDNDEIYSRTLEQVWKDGIASVNEYAMLDVLREKLNISPQTHLELEIQARKKSLPQTKIVKETVSQQTPSYEKPQQKIEKPIQSTEPQFNQKSWQKEEKPAQKVQPQPIREQTEKQYPCPICRQPLSYVAQYKRWYCYGCKKYA